MKFDMVYLGKDIRTKKQITISELAEKSEVNASTISRLEAQLTFPTVESLVRLGAALDVPFNDLIRTKLS